MYKVQMTQLYDGNSWIITEESIELFKENNLIGSVQQTILPAEHSWLAIHKQVNVMGWAMYRTFWFTNEKSAKTFIEEVENE